MSASELNRHMQTHKYQAEQMGPNVGVYICLLQNTFVSWERHFLQGKSGDMFAIIFLISRWKLIG